MRYLEQASREQTKLTGAQQNVNGVAGSQKPVAQDDWAQFNAPRVTQDLAIARAVLALDPYEPRLDPRERAHRAVKSYQAALARLADCVKAQAIPLPSSAASLPSHADAASSIPATPTQRSNADIAALYDRAVAPRNSVEESDLEHHPERIEPTLQTVFEIEAKVTARCGPPVHPEDAALVRIAQRGGNGRS